MTTVTPAIESELPPVHQCPKCSTPNPAKELVCLHCGRHLYLVCPDCGEVNFRGNEWCCECHSQLRQARHPITPPISRFYWPLNWSLRQARWWVVPAQVVLFIVAVVAGSYGTFRLAQWNVRVLIPPEPEVYILENGTYRRLETPPAKP